MSKWLQHNLQALEAIMMKFVELTVELRRGRTLKDGLHQFKGACINTNLQGLEAVIKKLVELSEERLATAVKQAAQVSVEKIEDLEEEMEASAWCRPLAEDAKERADRELVVPWFRFLWEVYRVVLDICRHNNKLELVYKYVAGQAFDFCRRFHRKSEFRRLCEILRHHLTIIVRYPQQQNGIVLTDAASHQLQLDIRFEQLNMAIELELWQEAFRTIEDIHGLFTLTRKPASPSMIVNYYERLAKIFLMSDNYLFLAAAWNKLFIIGNAQGQSQEYISHAANMFLLSTLSVPLMEPLNITNTLPKEERETQEHRLANFLGLQKIPSVDALFAEIIVKNALEASSVKLGSAFNAIKTGAIEVSDFKAIAESLKVLEQSDELSKFSLPIYINLVCLVFKSVSTKADKVLISSIKEIIECELAATSSVNIESLVLQGIKTGDFAGKINQNENSIIFERPCFDLETNCIQDELLNCQMTQLVQNIKIASQTIAKPGSKLRGLVGGAYEALEAEHKNNLERKVAIERKKEQLEMFVRQKEQDEARERAKKAQLETDAQKAKELEEARERERQKLEQERDEIRREQAKLRDAEIEAAKAKLQRTKDAEKLVAAFKRLDFLERAFRQEELPLLDQDYGRQKVEDRAAYDERVRLIRETSKTKHAADLEVKHHLTQMTEEYSSYLSKIKEARLRAVEARKDSLAQELEAAKESRRQEALIALHKRHDQQRAHEKLLAERAAIAKVEADRIATQKAEREGVASPAASKPAPYRPPAFQSRNSPSPSAPSAAPRSSASAFGSAWRGSGTEGQSDSKSVFGSSRPRQ